MKKLITFKDEISGKIFDKEIEAIESEKLHEKVKKFFNFYIKIKDEGCNFANGEWCMQRKKDFYNKLLKGLCEGVKILHPWIAKRYKDSGKDLTIEDCRSYYVGRCLNDGQSYLDNWRYKIDCICPKCYREYGQPYYANKCDCNGYIETKEKTA